MLNEELSSTAENINFSVTKEILKNNCFGITMSRYDGTET